MRNSVILAAMVMASLTGPTWAQSVPGKILADGAGQVVAAPDVAVIDISINTTRPTPVEALDSSGATITEVIAALADLGVDGRDLQTAGFSVSPDYGPEGCGSTYAEQFVPCALEGYEVRTSLSARIRAFDRLGAALAAVTAIETARISAVNFDVVDQAGRRQEAYAAAISAAQAKAVLTAQALGAELGRVIDVRRDSVGYGENTPATLNGVPRPESGEMADLIMLPTGELTFNQRVVVTYEIALDAP